MILTPNSSASNSFPQRAQGFLMPANCGQSTATGLRAMFGRVVVGLVCFGFAMVPPLGRRRLAQVTIFASVPSDRSVF